MSQNQSIKRLIKRIAIDALVMLLVGGVLVSAALWVSSLSEKATNQMQQMNTDISSKTGELQALKAQMAQFRDAVPVSEGLRDDEGKLEFDLSPDEATRIFLKLKDAYALQDVKVNITPPTASTESALVKPNMQVIVSDIGITMKAYSDQQVLLFINDAIKEFTGVVKIKKLSMSRGQVKSLREEREPTEEKTYNTPLLDVKIDMVWYGIQDIEKSTDAATAQGGQS